MPNEISQLAAAWDQSNKKTIGGLLFSQIHEKLLFLEHKHYRQYVPTADATYPDFESRLAQWIENVADESEKRLLLEFAPYITFFSREDFTKLFEAALQGPITRWIIDEMGLDFSDPDFDVGIQQELHHHTWFCPFSDSMPIADFHHANHIGGVDFRPPWRSLAKFGDRQRILDFMAQHRDANGNPRPLRRLVLLEDFIGSGAQMATPIREELVAGVSRRMDAVDFAASLDPIPVLLVPLIICPAGASTARALVARHKNIRYEAVLEIAQDQLISPALPLVPDSLEGRLFTLVRRCYNQVVGDNAAAPLPYTPYGVGETGARIVLYSNTPANTLPIIQHQSNTWTALFPRSARVR
jgi:hypothetical protein